MVSTQLISFPVLCEMISIHLIATYSMKRFGTGLFFKLKLYLIIQKRNMGDWKDGSMVKAITALAEGLNLVVQNQL